MKRALALLAAALGLTLAGAADATLLWSQTYAPDPSGSTFVLDIPTQPQSDPQPDLFLQVKGGTFQFVDWGGGVMYLEQFWAEVDQDVWILFGDDVVLYGTSDTQPRISSYALHTPPTYDHCYDSGYHAPGVCSFLFESGYGGGLFIDATVDAASPFTLTLSSGQPAPIPEPASWAMMIAGFAALGARMRTRRSLAPQPAFAAAPRLSRTSP